MTDEGDQNLSADDVLQKFSEQHGGGSSGKSNRNTKRKPPSTKQNKSIRTSEGNNQGLDDLLDKIKEDRKVNAVVGNLFVVFIGIILGSYMNGEYPRIASSAYNLREFLLWTSLISLLGRTVDVFASPSKNYVSVALLLVQVGIYFAIALGWNFKVS